MFAILLAACAGDPHETRSDSAAPDVRITEPTEGERFHQGESIELVGTVHDALDPVADLEIEWAIDGAVSVPTDLATEDAVHATVDASTLAVGEHVARLQAVDTDGRASYVHVGFVVAGPSGPPTVEITSPADGVAFEIGDTITFVGTASDLATPADALGYAWSSDVDGPLGNHAAVASALTEGTHVVTLEVTDADGEVGSTSIGVAVVQPHVPSIACGISGRTLVYADDFDDGSSDFSGVQTVEDVQGWYGLGFGEFLFSGDMLRSSSVPPIPLRLELEGLPAHTELRVAFVLAIIDSWDGLDSVYGGGPDSFNVTVDGVSVFSYVFNTTAGTSDYWPPVGGLLASGSDLGFNHGTWMENDQAFDMSVESELDAIPHTASSVAIELFASGPLWEGGTNESWAIDSLCISVPE